jgi:hypothetical protein
VPVRSARSGGTEGAGVRERAVQAEAVAHDDERGVERRADLVHGAEHELLELGVVQRRGFGGGHRSPFGNGLSVRPRDGRAGGATAHRELGPLSASTTPILGGRRR